MSEYSLKERVQMLTSSLVYGGPMTFEQIKKLDWLKNTSEYGILFYLREAERYEWIKTNVSAVVSRISIRQRLKAEEWLKQEINIQIQYRKELKDDTYY